MNKENCKLYIMDCGDPTVGIFPIQWIVECPFFEKEMEPENLEYFRQEQIKIYREFSEGKIEAIYDFELKNDLD